MELLTVDYRKIQKYLKHGLSAGCEGFTERMASKEILRQINKDQEIIKYVTHKQLGNFGHIIRNRWLQLIIQGKINGKEVQEGEEFSDSKIKEAGFASNTT